MGQQDRQGGRLRDGQGRLVTTLRVSLTDRCNFRCSYCMPPGGLDALPGEDFLSVADLARVVRLTASLGVSRYRLTGGEPLVRRDILDVVRALRPIEGVHELSMTTNGSRLAAMAGPLREAGLDRINVSLDSLEAARFARVSGSRTYARVREGIDAAIVAGFPVKINVVVLRDMPDDEILAFARLAASGRVEVRFLEFMPLCGEGWEKDAVYPIPEVHALVAKHHELCELPRGDAPARAYRMVGGGGRVGFIAPLSDPFCNTCSRIRLTADGRVRPCLFSEYNVDLGSLLRAGADDDALRDALLTAVRNKPRGSAFHDVPLARMDAAGLESAGGPPIRSIGG
jgi:cyclic pyranopterin phosphate synthase